MSSLVNTAKGNHNPSKDGDSKTGRKNLKNKDLESVQDWFANRTPPGRPNVMMALGHPTMLQALKVADLILGIDEATGNTFIAFGRSVLDEIEANNAPHLCTVIKVPILQATLELEALLAATSVAKGRHEYESYQAEAASPIA
jgi:hypothetical protein